MMRKNGGRRITGTARLAAAMAVCLALLAGACGRRTEPAAGKETPESTAAEISSEETGEPEEPEEPVIVAGEEERAASLLQENLEKIFGLSIPVIRADELEDGQPAVIFGSSKAREAETLADGLGKQEYLIQSGKDSLYLCAGEGGQELTAVYMFLGETLEAQPYTGTAKNAGQDFSGYSFRFTTDTEQPGEFTAMTAKVAHLKQQRAFNIMQGGCTDGVYAYYLMQDQVYGSGDCLIVKVDIPTWEILEISEPLRLDHGNGISYVPERGQFLVAHCLPDGRLLSWVDAETLTLAETVEIPAPVGSASWNSSHQRFACSSSGGRMLLLDENLETVNEYSGVEKEYSVQGYTAVDECIYVVCWDKNHILIYDWEGGLQKTIPIDIPSEMENMLSFGDLQYTAYLNAGADIYATVFYRTVGE